MPIEITKSGGLDKYCNWNIYECDTKVTVV